MIWPFNLFSKVPINYQTENKIQAWIESANKFIKSGEEEKANKYLEKVIQLDNNNDDALLLSAKLDMRQASYSSALVKLESVCSGKPENTEAVFCKAECHKALGENDLAISTFDNALQINPLDIFLLGSSAKLSREFNNLARATSLYLRILEIDPGNIVLLNLASIYKEQDNIEAAENIFKILLEKNPDLSPVRYNYALHLHDIGKQDDAIQILQLIIEETPEFYDAYYTSGRFYISRHQNEDALLILEELVNANPNYVKAYYDLGIVCLTLDKYDDAIDYFSFSIHYGINLFDSNFKLGDIYVEHNLYKEALEYYLVSIEERPESVEALHNIGYCYFELEEYAKAEEYYLHALELDNDNPNCNYSYAILHKQLGRFEKAMSMFQKVFDMTKPTPGQLASYGVLVEDIGDCSEAKAIFRNALDLDPKCKSAELNLALLLMKLGNFEEGWVKYRARWESKFSQDRNFPFNEWDGSSLSDKNILIYREQGIGDEIMFASCISEIVNEAQSVYIECSKKLFKLFTRSFPDTVVIEEEINKSKTITCPLPEHTWLKNVEPFDCQVAMGSCPSFLRKKITDFPDHNGYLSADSERVGYWNERLDSLGEGLKVGISWRGGTTKTRTFLRSIPLKQWGEILTIPGMQFISLQYTKCEDELEEVQKNLGITVHHWQDAIDDYDETAALVCALDHIVSIQTAIVHLSGALGQQIDVMVPFSAEWRYLATGRKMPWYPSVTLHRQHTRGNWEAVLTEVAAKLQAIC